MAIATLVDRDSSTSPRTGPPQRNRLKGTQDQVKENGAPGLRTVGASSSVRGPRTSIRRKKAVIFRNGAIEERGQEALLLQDDGYELVFIECDPNLVRSLNTVESYTVHRCGDHGEALPPMTVRNFRALDVLQRVAVAGELSSADVFITAVSVLVTDDVLVSLADGLIARSLPLNPDPLLMLLHNSRESEHGMLPNFLAMLDDLVRARSADVQACRSKLQLTSCCFDRTVHPARDHTVLDVRVEGYYMWWVDATPLIHRHPVISLANFVEDYEAHVYRKLYIYDVGRNLAALHALEHGIQYIHQAVANTVIYLVVRLTLREFSEYCIHHYGFSGAEQAAYLQAMMVRLRSPALPVTTQSVYEDPGARRRARRLLIDAATRLAAAGLGHQGFLDGIRLILRYYDVPGDVASQRLGDILRGLDARAAVRQIDYLVNVDSPFGETLVGIVASIQAEMGPGLDAQAGPEIGARGRGRGRGGRGGQADGRGQGRGGRGGRGQRGRAPVPSGQGGAGRGRYDA